MWEIYGFPDVMSLAEASAPLGPNGVHLVDEATAEK